jgi:hypothetical protein
VIDSATQLQVRDLVRREMDARLRSPVLNSQVSPRGVSQSRVATRLVTQMPRVAQDGDEVYFLADATNGIVWHLRYRKDTNPTYPWEFVGGPPLWEEIATSQGTTTTTYTDLATVGPAITVPLAGVFYVSHGASLQAATAAITEGTMSYEIGGTAASDDDWIYFVGRDQFDAAQCARTRRKTLATAGTTLTAKYRAQSGTQANFDDRWIAVEPIRVAA